MIKKIFKIFLIYILFFSSTYANSIDFYGEKNNFWDISEQQNIKEINNNLEKFYKKTGLNTDVVILGKGDSCYLKTNFDSCIQKKENYSSDLVIVLSMKSDIKSRGDIRSLIKDEFKESITPRELKNIQDSIIYNFKNKNFTKGILDYLSILENNIFQKCREVGVSEKCNAIKLAKQYHNYIAKKEAEKKYNAMMKIIYYIIFVIGIILSYLGLKKFYVKKINNLFKDIKYKSNSLDKIDLFKEDREEILKELYSLENIIKNKLGDLDKNIFELKNFYNKNFSKFDEINNKINEFNKLFLKRKDLQESLQKAKKIDL